MNITRNVVNDLLPAYFSAECSDDTRALVDEYFAIDREFEREARRAAEGLDEITRAAPNAVDYDLERTALKRTKRTLRIQSLFLALASTFTLNAISLGFSFEIRNGHVVPHWMTLPGQPQVVIALIFVAAVFWVLYARIRRHVRSRVLG